MSTASKISAAQRQSIFDADRDSLHILPLSIIPLQTQVLRTRA